MREAERLKPGITARFVTRDEQSWRTGATHEELPRQLDFYGQCYSDLLKKKAGALNGVAAGDSVLWLALERGPVPRPPYRR